MAKATKKANTPKKVTVAILDNNSCLIALKSTLETKVDEDDIVVPDECDLPTDGTYRWDGTCFVPLGHGHGKPKRPPISDSLVLYHVAKTMRKELPKEVGDWVDWYETQLKQRELEANKVKKG